MPDQCAFWSLGSGVNKQLTPSKLKLTGLRHDPSVLLPVSVTKKNPRDLYSQEKSGNFESRGERDSELVDEFRLAHRALVLVGRGASERNAVQQAAASDSHLTRAKGGALALVLGTVNELDLIDLRVRSALPDEKFGLSAHSLFRLATYAILRLGGKTKVRQIERNLRAICPVDLVPKFELLLGTLPAYDKAQFFSSLRDSERIALETHHPSWWVDYCFRMVGRGDAVGLLSSPPRPRYLRVNSLKNHSRITLPKALGHLVDRLTKLPTTPRVYTLDGSPSAFAEFLKDGLFQVQDLASYLAIVAGNPKPGEKVLDLCAAPGGKTAAMAQLMKNRGRIVSVDYSPGRMKAWKQEVKRLGVEIAEPVIGDAARLGLREAFDMVVVDPPCTGTGVFDRNPRMKWHLSPQSVDRYSILQRHFLDSAAPLVEQDGRILYCTCSLTVEENEGVVSTFLKSHPDFETRPVLEQHGSPGLKGMTECRRFYPHRDRTAGFFVARMERAE
jgi:16S rRNA (cytosine967-C5)-methyltransferase